VEALDEVKGEAFDGKEVVARDGVEIVTFGEGEVGVLLLLH